MALHKDTRLVLTSDAKPRLKWTQELHQQFVHAVNQLGGPDKATPKSLMKIMGIQGLTLYHLKSHLQKYRLGRSQQSQTYQHNKLEDSGGNHKSYFTEKICDGAEQQINENLQVACALKVQMEVQRKLHEQLEVQRHLQLRIEAQGKYLQSVLKKAQETLSGYSSSSIEVEQAKAQLSQLLSMVDSGCSSSSFSLLTENDGSILRDAYKKPSGHNGYSLESSLTSSESSGRKEPARERYKIANCKTNEEKRNGAMLSLMEMHPSENKRSKGTVGEVILTEHSTAEKSNSDEQEKRFGMMGNIDVNSGSKVIDLNLSGVEI